MIKERIAQIKDKISSICHRIGRDPESITLIGVTKYSTLPQIKEAIQVGLDNIGENKVQDAQEKFDQLKDDHISVTRHMLGHLQTNKVKVALGLFDLIQSVDSLRLGEEIDKQAAKLNKKVDILIEVNTSGEEQKFGVKKEEAVALAERLSALNHVRVLGLMTMAPYTEDKGIIRRCFRDLRLLKGQMEGQFQGYERVAVKYLSMGMSGDYEIALEEGSNMVRIGTAIFGK